MKQKSPKNCTANEALKEIIQTVQSSVSIVFQIGPKIKSNSFIVKQNSLGMQGALASALIFIVQSITLYYISIKHVIDKFVKWHLSYLYYSA